MKKIKDGSLYLIITEVHGKGRSAVDIAGSAIEGGVDIIQMREKNKPRTELVELGKKLSRLCSDNNVIFIVNDDPNLAREVNADGVHLGQEDAKLFPIDISRSILGPGKIIGVSTHSIEQFKEANEKDFDYAAFGPIFATKTKDYFIGVDSIEKISGIAKNPVFFIGGISLSNIGDCLNRGAENIALIRGITEADDIADKTKKFKKEIKDGNKNKRKK
ncbi:MAG: thiamine phosphate synthase [Candidatus Omnitrophota bacterium]|nr:thiamine phosphate synthase [Candidatus Omnitrophota bacterium]